ncbi:hypothetical protein DIPPA_20903 [Diplonema papillatum]|nr:hypothetical protein DIPPA_20903 [Diplonema papillatum]
MRVSAAFLLVTAAAAAPDCSLLKINQPSAGGDPCVVDDVLMSGGSIEQCMTEICAKLTPGQTAGYAQAGKALQKPASGPCTLVDTASAPVRFVCGRAAAGTKYMQVFSGFDEASAIAVLGATNDRVLVAGSAELTVMVIDASGGFSRAGALAGTYRAVLPAEGWPNVAYALSDAALVVVGVDTPAMPSTLGSVNHGCTSAVSLAQFKTNTAHLVYIGCDRKVTPVDVRSNTGPALGINLITASDTRSLLVDATRGLLFVTTTGGIAMYNLTKPGTPAVGVTESLASLYGMALSGTLLFVAQKTQLVVYDTVGSLFQASTPCCDFGTLDLVEVEFYNGFVYASDLGGRLVVLDASGSPVSYAGARELPPSVQPGGVVVSHRGSTVRVLQAAGSYLAVYSDSAPAPTPAPPTPPARRTNCAVVTVFAGDCSAVPLGENYVLENRYIVADCLTSICPSLAGGMAAFASTSEYVTKTGTTCNIVSGTAASTAPSICAPAPPLTTYAEATGSGDTRDVAVVGYESDNHIAVAMANSIDVFEPLHAGHSTGFNRVGTLPTQLSSHYYVSVLRSDTAREMVYALRPAALEIVSISTPTTPTRVTTVSLPDVACVAMAQLTKSLWQDVHLLYVSCNTGTFAVDMSDESKPVLLNGAAAVLPTSTARLCLDDTRGLLFAAATPDKQLLMYDLSKPAEPVMLASEQIDATPYKLVVSGTIVYIAAEGTLLIYETASRNFTQVGWCCASGPSFNIVGVSIYDSIVFAPDKTGSMLVVMNVSDPTATYYVGHRALPSGAAGGEGIVVALLGDNIQRVLVAAGGLVVFSDDKAIPTPSPPTPLPPPPVLPPDCDSLYVHNVDSCLDGDVLMSEHMIDACNTELCVKMASGWQAGFDSPSVTSVFTKSGSSCDYGTASTVQRFICGPAPPYTTYMEHYDNTFLPQYALAADLEVVGQDKKHIYIASSSEITVMHVKDNGRLQWAGSLAGSYKAITKSQLHPNTVYGLRGNRLDIIDVSSPAAPSLIVYLILPVSDCKGLEQLTTVTSHQVFLACGYKTVLVVSTKVKATPILLTDDLAALPNTDEPKGMLVDNGRQLLFIATGNSSRATVHMYDAGTFADVPNELSSVETASNSYEMALAGTMLLVAATTRLEIYETTASKLSQAGWCCYYGPDLFLVGLAVYNELAYALDYQGRLVVMNVTNAASSYYIGHRDLPAGSGGSASGREGIAVDSLGDGTVRVMIAAHDAGLVVFSDSMPAATPTPQTPFPPPPTAPLSCGAISVSLKDIRMECPDGKALANKHMVETCKSDLCDDLPDGMIASYDGPTGSEYFVKSSDICSFATINSVVATHSVCQPPPPHMMYMEVHSDDVLIQDAKPYYVAVLGSDRNSIVVATNTGLSILRPYHSNGFRTVSHVPGNYYAVMRHDSNPDIAYALTLVALDVVRLSPPSEPEIIGTVSGMKDGHHLAQYTKGTNLHVVYASCRKSGVFAIDVTDNAKPVILNGGAAVILRAGSGQTRGILVDEGRDLLFVGGFHNNNASNQGVLMYDITDPASPLEIGFQGTGTDEPTSTHELTLAGTIIYVAAEDQMEIYDTVGKTFKQLGWCCAQAPEFFIIGVAYYDGYIYAGDYSGMLLVMNVTNNAESYYVSHRELPLKNGNKPRGREGLLVTALGDGIVRVLVPSDAAGLVVFSDTEPVATPSPVTPIPPAPLQPPDCDSLYVHLETLTGTYCLEGDMQMSREMIEACNSKLCQEASNGQIFGYDGPVGSVWTKASGLCAFSTSSQPTQLRHVCGPAPRHTTYMEQYGYPGVLPLSARALDLVVLGEEDIGVVTNAETTFLHLKSNGRLQWTASLVQPYIKVLGSSFHSNIIFALRDRFLDIVDVSSPTQPSRLLYLSLSASSCHWIDQISLPSLHYVFVVCSTKGIVTVDTTDKSHPTLLTLGAASSTGAVQEILVDSTRLILFTVTSGNDSSLHMYDFSKSATTWQELDNVGVTSNSYAMLLVETTLYLAASTRLEVYDTSNFKLDMKTWCCEFGPDLALTGLQHYEGQMYASDYRGWLVVINITDLYAPHYLGHRDLPLGSGGTASGRDQIVIARLSDSVVRVMVAAGSAGLVVFSDTEPSPTPTPRTPFPPPPTVPLNCGQVKIYEKTNRADCPAGTALSNEHMIRNCLQDLCDDLSAGTLASYDSSTNNQYMGHNDDSCAFVTIDAAFATHSVCQPPPPHTMYMEIHSDDVLVQDAKPYYVAVLGQDRNNIIVATNTGLSILRAYHSNGFRTLSHVPGNYYAVMADDKDADIAYALTLTTLDVVRLSPPSEPEIIGSVSGMKDGHHLAQLTKTNRHVVYASCRKSGVFAIDVTDNAKPVILNGGAAVILRAGSGQTRGILVDEGRDLLFVGGFHNNNASNQGVLMYDITDPASPLEIGFQGTGTDEPTSTHELTLAGTIIYVAAEDQMEIYDTVGKTFKQLGWCCAQAPEFFIIGVAYYDGYIYAGDYSGMLLVMNVENNAESYYVSHRELPIVDGGKPRGREGVFVAALGDGIVRVLVPADAAGLVVFSDTEPVATPMPVTPFPPPPLQPPDCDSLYIHDASTDGNTCLDGDVLMSEHMIDACLDPLCAKMTGGWQAGYDSETDNKVFTKTGTTCTHDSTSNNAQRYVCGAAPPHTTYMEQYSHGFLGEFALATDVVVLGDSKEYVLVASSSEMTVLHVKTNGRLLWAASLAESYKAVLTSEVHAGVVYGLQGNRLDLVDVSTPTKPSVLVYVSLSSQSCTRIEQASAMPALHLVFVSCDGAGVLLVDVRDKAHPYLIGGGGWDSLAGDPKGMLLDYARSMMFIATSGSDSTVYMYDVTNPASPTELSTASVASNSFEMALGGTILYVAAKTRLEIYETLASTLDMRSWCCVHGPEMALIGLQVYEGLMYATDYHGRLVVANVTNPEVPYYIGHRDLPASSGGSSSGRENIAITPLSDDVVRVLVAAENGGLVVFSDTVPAPTPTPRTPFPPPPTVPLNCGQVKIYEKTNRADCPAGTALSNEHMIRSCLQDLCDDLSAGTLASYDSSTNNQYMVHNDDSCAFATIDAAFATHSVCQPPPPHTMYMEIHSDDVLVQDAKPYYVAVLGQDRNNIIVATNTGLSILRAYHSNGFRTLSHVPGNYYAVMADDKDADIAYALTLTTLDVVRLSPPSEPEIIGSVSGMKDGHHLAQLTKTNRHVVYASCRKSGVFAIDVTDNAKPVILNGGAAVILRAGSGQTRGILVDEGRDLLFVGGFHNNNASNQGVLMYDITDPASPLEIGFQGTGTDEPTSTHELTLAGTIIYVAAEDQMEIYDTVGKTFKQLGWCCAQAPEFFIIGVAYYDGYIYAGDYSGMLLVMNVENNAESYYVSHRELPIVDGGKPRGREGVFVAALGDGIVRVLVPADAAGLVVFSDTEPVATPMPVTPFPPPPLQPPDCDSLYIHDASTDGNTCLDGDVLMSEHMIDACLDPLCAKMTGGWQAGYDSETDNKVFTKTGTTCTHDSTSNNAQRYVCGAAPPHTTYMEQYSHGFLGEFALATDVVVLGDSKEYVLVASSSEMTVLHVKTNGRLLWAASLAESYKAVLTSEVHAGVVYGLQGNRLDLVDVSTPTKPSVLVYVSLSSQSCTRIEQASAMPALHLVFVSCDGAGVLLVDVRDKAHPYLIGGGGWDSLAGDPKGMLLDYARSMMFIATSGSDSTVYMYDVTNPASPTELSTASVASNSFEMALGGTILYVAAKTRLEIYETLASTLDMRSWCCVHGPEMALIGLQVYEGLMYATDYHGRLVVANVTNPEVPYYIGHRDLPASSGGSSSGRENIAITPLSDDVVRVLVAAENGGLVVFSDTVPAPTPTPRTPFPPPPTVPLNCGQVKIYEKTNRADCPAGTALSNEHMIRSCLQDLCDDLSAGTLASYDSSTNNQYMVHNDDSCAFATIDAAFATHSVCQPPPPHTMYMEIHSDDVLVQDAKPYYVAVLGQDRNNIIVATNTGLSILRAYHSNGFRTLSHVPGNYYAVMADDKDADIAYALTLTTLDVVRLSPPSEPEIIGSVSGMKDGHHLAQLTKTNRHVVYASCRKSGVFAIDVTDNAKPVILNGGAAVILRAGSGQTRGILVDEGRDLLFVGGFHNNNASNQGVLMYDITDPASPLEIGFQGTGTDEPTSTHELTLAGTIIYVAAEDQMEIYDTVGKTFKQLGWCCAQAPEFFIIGVAYYDGYIYAGDYSGMLLVMNVENNAESYYVSHRELPIVDGGKPRGREGVFVAALGDGIVRVLVPADAAGLVVFSDTEPVATPMPVTPFPPPPLQPPDCDSLYIHDASTDGNTCLDGDVLMSEHMIDACLDPLCAKMTGGWQAGYDSETDNKVFTKTGTTCTHDSTSNNAQRYVCGAAPPHTTYMEQYSHGFLGEFALATDVVVLGDSKEYVLVASSSEMTVLHVKTNGRLLWAASLAESYKAVLTSEVHAGVVYGLQGNRLDLVDVSTPTKPSVLVYVSLSSQSCTRIEQASAMPALHLVFVSCDGAGVLLVDVRDKAHPYLIGGGGWDSLAGDPKGMLLDYARSMMFIATSGSDSTVYMYDVTNPASPTELSTASVASNSFEMALGGTILYVAAKTRLEIYETLASTLDMRSWCCVHGPEMALIGLQVYEGLMYATDYHGRLVVANVTNPEVPYYIGHRDLPASSGGSSSGRENIAITPLSDDVVRVLVAAENGGLVVFSDTVPAPTPTPRTPFPPPPTVPLNCGQVKIYEKTNRADCPAGTALSNEHMIRSCLQDLCDDLSAGTLASYDSSTNNQYMVHNDDSCAFATIDAAFATHSVCQPPPPHTMYMEIHSDDVLVQDAKPYYVAVLGQDRNNIIVATNTGLSILRAYHSNGFRTLSHVPGNYYAVMADDKDADIAYALTLTTLDVVRLSPPSEPEIIGSVSGMKDGHHLAQLTKTNRHVVYASCRKSGVFAIDVTDNAKPVILNGGAAVILRAGSGQTRGILVDEGRDLLFVGGFHNNNASNQGVLMYDITDPASPLEIGFQGTGTDEPTSTHELTLAGTIIYVAAEDQMEIYDTVGKTFKQLGWCCAQAPEFFIIGVAYYDGYIYAGDYSGMLLVMNVENNAESYYVSHRELPIVDGGKPRGREGVFVAALGDGIVRVLVPADAAGLVVFSDTEPVATPMPVTPFPPPPLQPPDCDSLYIHDASTDGNTCLDGDVLMSEHMIDACLDPLCAKMTGGWQAGYDSETDNKVFTKTGTTCTHDSTSNNAQRYVCGAAPPHTTYMEQYSHGFLGEFALATDVVVLGDSKEYVLVASSSEMTVLHVKTNGRLLWAASLAESYKAVLTSEVHAGVVYGLQGNRLDLVDVSTPTKPSVLVYVSLSSQSCTRIEQASAMPALHLVFVSCDGAGVLLVDVRDKAHPYLIGGGGWDSLAGDPKGMLLDYARSMMFIATSGSDSTVYMYDVTNPASPTELSTASVASNSFEMALGGTILYVAAKTRLEIYETLASTLDMRSWCCVHGPEMALIGLQVYEGLMYATDYHGRLVVANVTNPEVPYYIGHRDLPASSGGSSSGRENIAITPLSDDVVRVLVAAENGGLVVFSDTVPAPTPTPRTPFPPPPTVPLNCGQVKIYEKTNRADCPAGTALSNEHMIRSCLQDLCDDLSAGTLASYDSSTNNQYMVHNDDSCAFATIDAAFATHSVCQPPPPHTMYMEIHSDDVLVQDAKPYYVAVLGQDRNNIIVATNTGLSILRAYHSNGFRTLSHVPGNYYAVMADDKDADIAYALTLTTLDVVRLSPPSEPEIIGSVSGMKDGHHLAQLTKTNRHVVYASCRKSGVFAIDVTDNAKPVILNGGAAVILRAGSGQTRGILVDEGRDLLFVGGFHNNNASNQGVLMYDITDPASPLEIGFQGTGTDEPTSTHELTLAGTIIYVAAEDQMEIYDTVGKTFKQLGWCCAQAPEFFIIGVAYYDGYIYAGDYSGMLLVMNVENNAESYYVSHRELPIVDGGKPRGREGVFVAALGDGIVRVLVPADAAGLVVFSDTEPVATPMPVTPFPPPPLQPPDCDSLYIHDASTDGNTCLDGDVLMSEHMIDACLDPLCAKMTGGWQAGYDSETDNKVFTKTGTTCTHDSTSNNAQRYVCGAAPPYTTYREQYDHGFLGEFALATDVVVLGDSKDYVLVASSSEMTVLQVKGNGRLLWAASLAKSYKAVLISEVHAGVVYGLQGNRLDLVDVSKPTEPSVLVYAPLPSHSCTRLQQASAMPSLHVLFVSCEGTGVLVIDAKDNGHPYVSARGALPLATPADIRGILLDGGRWILFVATSGSDSSVYMYDVSDPASPVELSTARTVSTSCEMALAGTILYVAGSTKLEIYETAGVTLDMRSWCCVHGPEVSLIGLQYYAGLIYASEYHGRLVVMNVTNPEVPYYIGHRDLPASSGGSSSGRENVVVSALSDDIVRVLVAAENGGLIVFSDVEPAATPTPETRVPTPPTPPLDCGQVKVYEKTDGVDCPNGTALSNDHMIKYCMEDLCDDLPEGALASYDGPTSSQYLVNSEGSCSLLTINAASATHSICQPPPPLTTYLEVHSDDVLVDGAKPYYVAVLGHDSNDIIVATSTGLSVLRAIESNLFIPVSHVPGNYYDVIRDESDADIAYALSLARLDVVRLTPPSEPEIIGSISGMADGHHLAQLTKKTDRHVVYASCRKSGVFAIDVIDNQNPVLLNGGVAVILRPEKGQTRGLVVDEGRDLLLVAAFDSNVASNQGVLMYDITDPASPQQIGFQQTGTDKPTSTHELTLVGTIIYVAAEDQMEVYDTAGKTFARLGWCCQNGPEFFIIGVAYHEGFIYAGDYSGMMLVMNVEDTSAPFYVSHRELPVVDGKKPRGREGIMVSTLGDGIPRVLVPADAAGLVVFSDVQPRRTPPPSTPEGCGVITFAAANTNTTRCPEGYDPLSRKDVDECINPICDKLDALESAAFDDVTIVKSESGTCTYTSDTSETATYALCKLHTNSPAPVLGAAAGEDDDTGLVVAAVLGPLLVLALAAMALASMYFIMRRSAERGVAQELEEFNYVQNTEVEPDLLLATASELDDPANTSTYDKL